MCLAEPQTCINLKRIARSNAVINGDNNHLRKQFPRLFSCETGRMNYLYDIQLNHDSQPVCLFMPRKIAHPLMAKVEEQIDDMLEKEIRFPVTETQNWCSSMVVVTKPNGKVHICVDYTQLNKAVKRQIHPMHSVDESLSQLAGSKIFSKLDAKSGFWQIPITKHPKPLTCFITPFSRFAFYRLPFGLSSASEIFQRTISQILAGLPGVVCYMDNILVHAADRKTHDQRLCAVLQ